MSPYTPIIKNALLADDIQLPPGITLHDVEDLIRDMHGAPYTGAIDHLPERNIARAAVEAAQALVA